jgi:cell fate (sporulation/competence/biofilm development) regulator YmcA (YheA/YmcA/DUF963 family)
MEEKLLNAVNNLKDALNNTSEVKHLNELDKKINEDEELGKLFKLFREKEEELNNHLKTHNEFEKSTKGLKQELSKIKYQIDINPLVKEYNTAYREVNKLYAKIDKELFTFFNETDKENSCSRW